MLKRDAANGIQFPNSVTVPSLPESTQCAPQGGGWAFPSSSRLEAARVNLTPVSAIYLLYHFNSVLQLLHL